MIMDLDGDDDLSLDDLWCGDEEKVELSRVNAPPATRSIGFLLLLTSGLAGLQFVFALVFSNGSAYLNNLGLSRPVLSLVWTAGPVAGMVLQPYFGIWSDQLGKRRPFILYGAVAIIASLVGQAFVPAALSRAEHPLAAQFMAVLFMVTLNMAIQPLQGGLRAQLSDACPRAQQPAANALAVIAVSMANVASYVLALVDLPKLFSLDSSSQFSMLCVITSIVLALAVGLNFATVREGRDYAVQRSRGSSQGSGPRLLHVITSFRRLPRQVQQVCKVQFLSWMGWFPFLFYMTTHVAAIYHRQTPKDLPLDAAAEAKSTRIGSLGLLLFAVMGLVSGVALPLAHQQAGTDAGHMKTVSIFRRIFQCWAGSIQRLWLVSHLLYAACMFAAFFATSLAFVCILVGLCGVSWAVTIWAPWTVIGLHVSYDLDDSDASLSLIHEYGGSEEDCSELSVEPKILSRQRDGLDTCERRPGIVFGLHNAFIAGPQILAAVVCSFIFWAVEGTRQDGVGWAMLFGGLAALGAAYLATGLEEDNKVGV